jgi:hypothetical protein
VRAVAIGAALLLAGVVYPVADLGLTATLFVLFTAIWGLGLPFFALAGASKRGVLLRTVATIGVANLAGIPLFMWSHAPGRDYGILGLWFAPVVSAVFSAVVAPLILFARGWTRSTARDALVMVCAISGVWITIVGAVALLFLRELWVRGVLEVWFAAAMIYSGVAIRGLARLRGIVGRLHAGSDPNFVLGDVTDDGATSALVTVRGGSVRWRVVSAHERRNKAVPFRDGDEGDVRAVRIPADAALSTRVRSRVGTREAR